MKIIRPWLNAATILLAFAWGVPSQAQSPAQAPAGTPAVRWEPEFRFARTFFPSFAIAAAGRDATGPTLVDQVYGYVNSGSLAVKVLAAPAGSKLKAQVEIPEIGVTGELETLAPADGKPLAIVPRLSWSQRRLTSIVQPLSSDAIFRLFSDGVLVGEERRPVRIRAINDVPLN